MGTGPSGSEVVSDDSRLQAIVVHPYIKFSRSKKSASESDAHKSAREPDLALEEAVRLAEAINLNVVHSRTLGLSEKRPSTLIGKGMIEQLFQQQEDLGKNLTILIVNHDLTPVQQRNLEKQTGMKVLDRTALILEIFGERAQTRAGQLQVELAAQQYQRSRLVRSWTHLERQRGGAGFMGGPGESQLEIDRRLISERITHLKKDLKKVSKTRDVNRLARQRNQYPVVALVGYTNAGKSTLFNTLTGAKILAKDMLFATLDPTMRVINLPDKGSAILADTVGFITDLPTSLIEAFKSTLEETTAADLILHVRDIAHPETEEQKADVEKILQQLKIDPNSDKHTVLEVWNKVDLLPDHDKDYFNNAAEIRDNAVCTSATEKEGTEQLLQTIHDLLNKGRARYTLEVPHKNGQIVSWVHDHGKVETQVSEDHNIVMTALLTEKDAKQLEKHFKSQEFTLKRAIN